MKTPLALAAGLLAAGCATQPDVQVAQAECKVMPVTTMSVTGRKPTNVSPLEQRYAQMQLATSEYRMRQLRERGMDMNNVEDALHDCSTAR
jgi:hypothetical protein